MDKGLSRDEAWDFMYRVRPYLDGVADEELSLRLSDVLRNLYTLTAEGKVGALAPDQGGLIWLERFAHLQLEYRRRNKKLEEMVRPEDVPFNRAALELVRANPDLKELAEKTGAFCRYGELRWMKTLFERGELRLSPASYYKAASHGVARQDDELLLPIVITPFDYDLGRVPAILIEHLPQRCWAFVEHEKPCDHYLYCVTIGFDFRHFVDFGVGSEPAEACVLITEKDEFERRLLKALRERLPRWHIEFGMVKYIDPYSVVQILPNDGGTGIFFFKNFRYMYQREHRAVALPPPELTGPHERIQISLGSLEDIARLVVLRRPNC